MMIIVMAYDKSRDGDDNYAHNHDNNSRDNDDNYAHDHDNNSRDDNDSDTGGMNDIMIIVIQEVSMTSFSDQRTSTITNNMIFHICWSYMMQY